MFKFYNDVRRVFFHWEFSDLSFREHRGAKKELPQKFLKRWQHLSSHGDVFDLFDVPVTEGFKGENEKNKKKSVHLLIIRNRTC